MAGHRVDLRRINEPFVGLNAYLNISNHAANVSLYHEGTFQRSLKNSLLVHKTTRILLEKEPFGKGISRKRVECRATKRHYANSHKALPSDTGLVFQSPRAYAHEINHRAFKRSQRFERSHDFSRWKFIGVVRSYLVSRFLANVACFIPREGFVLLPDEKRESQRRGRERNQRRRAWRLGETQIDDW